MRIEQLIEFLTEIRKTEPGIDVVVQGISATRAIEPQLRVRFSLEAAPTKDHTVLVL